MKLRTRTLMAVVALVALALATPGELRSRRERRHVARIAEHYLKFAALHESLRSDGHQPRPYYDPLEREWANQASFLNIPRFTSWEEEDSWHAKEAAACREGAAVRAREEQAIRGRLLLPVIFDIERKHQ